LSVIIEKVEGTVGGEHTARFREREAAAPLIPERATQAMDIRHRLTRSQPALLLEFPGMETGSFNGFLATALGLLPAP